MNAVDTPKLCEHQVPADQCTQCNPDLSAAFKDMGDWCEEHGLPESHCRVCHPDLKFGQTVPKGWCREHGVPESKCTKCKPSLIAKFIGEDDYCREHGYPASVCPIHHPEIAKAAGVEPPVFPLPGTIIRLASVTTAEDVGIETVRIEKKPYGRTLEVVGHLEFNQNRLAQLSSRGDALVMEVRVDVGDTVKAGQPLATLTSAAVGAGQGQLVAAEARLKAAAAEVEREQDLVQRGVSPRKNLDVAETEFAAAKGEYGAAKAALGAAGAAISPSGGRYVVSAPFAGVVVSRNAVVGKSSTAGASLFEVADLSAIWAQLDIPESEAGAVRPGQKVSIAFEATRITVREATIARVSAAVDPRTRTVEARVELPNEDRSLKAGTFVRATIAISGEKDALLVPRDAVQRAEGRSILFVKKGESIFAPVAVELGGLAGELIEVVKGISPGTEVVTTGAFLLKTELMKESIGAGCCEDPGGG